MSILRALLAPWHWTQRRIDLQVLWPACKQEAFKRRDQYGGDDWLDRARGAFALHCHNDGAWLVLGDEEISRRIGRLK